MGKTFYIVVFIIFSISSYIFIKCDTDTKIERHLALKTHQVTQNYNMIYNKYRKIATIIFQTKLDTPQIKKILAKTLDASPSKTNKAREELFRELKDTYALLKTYNLKQLHFHTPNNDSFLRLHKPEKFGDNLTDIRATVKYVNATHKAVDGFEEGRFYNGYRFVFPLIYENRYLGSVEVSFSTLAMSSEFRENYGIDGRFFISQKVISKKVFDYAQSNYAPSEVEGFYYERAVHKALEKHHMEKFSLSNKIKKVLHKQALSKESFSIYDQKHYTVYTILKIMNPITKKVVALFVIRDGHSAYISELITHSFLLFIVLELLFLFILVFIYKTQHEKEILNEEIEKKTQELQKINLKLEEYVELIDENVITSSTNLRGIITDVSEAFCQISGYSKEELIGASHNLIRHPDMEEKFFENLWATIQNDEIFKGEIKNRKKDGSYYWVDTIINPTFDEDGNKIGYIAIRQDITNKKKIEEISITDVLTDTYNRRHFNTMLPLIINSAKRDNEYIAFLMIDIDYFKQYNDTYGHQKGDKVLQDVTTAMKKTLKRASDYCFRLGGEEFAVIYKVRTKEDAKIFADNLRIQIENLKIPHEKNSISAYVTVSIGLVCLKAKEIESEAVIYNEADKLLYLAKENGRNRVESNF